MSFLCLKEKQHFSIYTSFYTRGKYLQIQLPAWSMHTSMITCITGWFLFNVCHSLCWFEYLHLINEVWDSSSTLDNQVNSQTEILKQVGLKRLRDFIIL